MSMSKYKRRECTSPVREPVERTEVQPSSLEEPQAAENPVQIEFLKFLKNLDDVPNQIAEVGYDGAADPGVDAYAEADAEVDLNNADHLNHVSIEIQFDPSDLQAPQPPNPTQLPLHGEAATEQPLESLLNHNFLHKLHLAASSEHVPFINWTLDGEQLQLDYLGLQEHLGSSQCMFRSRSMTQFICQLTDVGFERVVPSEPYTENSPQMYYEHACFKAYQVDELLLMSTPQFERQPTQHQATAKNVPGTFQTSYSSLQLARFRFQTLLRYNNDVRLLQELEPSTEQLLPRRGRAGVSQQAPAFTLAPSLASKLMNPHDSVLQFEAGKVPDYAGFYGQVEHNLICQFFSEYLPRYGTSTSGYKDIVVDVNKTNSFQQNLPIGLEYSEDEEDSGNQGDQLAAASNSEPAELADCANPLPEDIELEQVMQELCDVEAEQQKHLLTSLKPKLKRKRLVKKSTVAGDDPESESPTEELDKELLHTLNDIEDFVATATAGSANNSMSSATEENQSPSKGPYQNAPKGGSKHRRYDLRTSNPKRSIQSNFSF